MKDDIWFDSVEEFDKYVLENILNFESAPIKGLAKFSTEVRKKFPDAQQRENGDITLWVSPSGEKVAQYDHHFGQGEFIAASVQRRKPIRSVSSNSQFYHDDIGYVASQYHNAGFTRDEAKEGMLDLFPGKTLKILSSLNKAYGKPE